MSKKININSLVLAFMLVIWLLPFVQGQKEIFKIEELGGVSKNAVDTLLNSETWLDGIYAEKKQNYLNDKFGFRPLVIKLQNQIQYSLYGKTNAEDVILGKSNYLFELKYIKSFFGIDYVGEKHLIDKVYKLRYIQDTLKKLNKTLIFLIAPSKASFFSEFLPEAYKTDSIYTNYKVLRPMLSKQGINFIDYSQMFRNLKDKTSYSLYPVAGTHWSEYGIKVALDSLTHYIENKTDFILSKMDYSEVNLSDGYEGTDNDMGKAINLLFPPDYGKLAYPNVKYSDPSNLKKPNVLMVSDSYWMSIYYSHVPEKLFNRHSFWYYYNVSSDYSHETEGKSPLDLNLKEEIDKKDIICIMCTEPNLKSIGYRFVEDCYDLFKNGKLDEAQRKRLARIEKERMYLWNDKDGCERFAKIATKENRPLDSVIVGVARYMVDSSN